MAAVWVLNLDADLELGHGAGYGPSRSTAVAMKAHAASLARTLLAEGDVWIDADVAPNAWVGRVGKAFCPTPRALALLARAGASPEPHPGVDVLRHVNGRGFSASLGRMLPGASFVTDRDVLRATLRRPPPLGAAWRTKRAFGMAGRGHRVVGPREATDAVLATFDAALAQGGLQVEPDVRIVREFGVHGRLDPGGALRIGCPVAQRCDARGQWIASEIAADLAPGLVAALEGEVRAVAEALHDAGYFGPFGIDAFEYLDDEGNVNLQPRSEINARYSMGFALSGL